MIEAKGSLTGELNVGTRKEKYRPRWVSFYQYDGSDLIAEVENLDTSNITNMYGIFYYCYRLTTLDISNFNTSNVTVMTYMFYGCKNLTEIKGLDKLDTSNVEKMNNMFEGCEKMVTLNLSDVDMGKVNSIYNTFKNCKDLENLILGKNLGKNFTNRSTNNSQYKIDLSASTLLTHDSLMSVINNLYDLNLTYKVATGGTLYRQQLVLGSTNLAKLTDDEIAIATDKGWNVS